jgi:L-Ala-D/L-Glu epimerase / N-acetyl-D-glutamate racemase
MPARTTTAGTTRAAVARIDVLTVELPFRFSFGHALAARRSSTNVLVRLELDDGSVGYGEGVPREYVTGETVEGAVEALVERLAPPLLGRTLTSPGDVPDAAEETGEAAGAHDLASRCALELAVLDAAGKHFGISVQHWLGRSPAPIVEYDAIVPFSSPRKLKALALVIRALGFRNVKVKVGDDLDEDVRKLIALRRILGHKVDLRVDANCAWNAEEALRAIEFMRPARISAVEQPVPADDLEGLRRVTASTSETIIVDESLRTVEEANVLAESRACDAFNIRVSKCGGLLQSAKIAAIAAENGLDCVVGAQVGESGILSAAGRHLAATIRPRYVEGSAGRLLLKEDLSAEGVLPRRRGRARSFTGPGLGITVKDATLRKYGRLEQCLQARTVTAR